MSTKAAKWLFFDVGTTLVDETEAYHHRIRDAIEGSGITFEQFQEKRIFFAGQNLKGDLEAIKYFGLKKIGVIANQSAGTAGRLDKWGLLQYIDVVAASAELGVVKPDRAIFDKALEMAGCAAQDAVMIGDRLDNDITPAKKLGMKAIWIRQGFAIYQNPEMAEYRPDYTVDRLSDLKELF